LDVENRTLRQLNDLQAPWASVKTFSDDQRFVFVTSEVGVFAVNVESGQAEKVPELTGSEYIIRSP
ncbi:MAG TPA: hypothetical protein VFF68_00640, partial [Anaerolineaceae bacterium]|nr:hypothetical protein [Anaerolineaceae bacterium]